MSLINIPKNYQDGDPLFESDLDDIRTGTEDFLNVTQVDDDNIQDNGITASNKLVDKTISTAKLQNAAVTAVKIAANAVTRSKLAVIDQTPPGSVQMFHTFNGTVSIPRGWMKCNGDVVNKSNYDAIHSGGDYDTDGVSSSPLDGKNLPDMTGQKYAAGTSDTTQDGSSAITTVGNSSSEIDIRHNHTVNSHQHEWLQTEPQALGGDDGHQTYGAGFNTPSAIETNGVATNNSGGDTVYQFDVSSVADGGSYTKLNVGGNDTDSLYTSPEAPGTGNSLSTTQNIQPESIEFIYIIKVV